MVRVVFDVTRSIVMPAGHVNAERSPVGPEASQQHNSSAALAQRGNMLAQVPEAPMHLDIPVEDVVERERVVLGQVLGGGEHHKCLARIRLEELDAHVGHVQIEALIEVERAVVDVEAVLDVAAADIEEANARIQLIPQRHRLTLGDGLSGAGVVRARDGELGELEAIAHVRHPLVADLGSHSLNCMKWKLSRTQQH